MPVAISKLEHFFREVGGVNVDKSDLDRYETFVNRKLHDLLIRAEATAKANGRDIVRRVDVPVTKGLQEAMQRFESIAAETPIRQALEQFVARPPLDLAYDDELDARLPELAGGLSVVLARSFRIMDPKAKHPPAEHWDRTFQLFDLVL